MAKHVLTENNILNATAYMPIAQKVTTAKSVAALSISKVEVNATDDNDKTRSISLPSRYVENTQVKSMYQMVVLLKYYLGQDFGENLTTEEYDEWGESAIFNQLDRFKQSKNPDVRNRVYDLLDDYRELCKYIGSEIASRLAAQNDPFARIGAWLIEQMSAETMSKVREYLVGMKDEIQAYNESRSERGLN